MIKASISFFFFLLGFCLTGSYAQNLNTGPSNQTSAQASNSSIVANDLFNGTANVAIPFYSTSFAGIALGVSINYNTVGVPVDKLSSTVGLGWELFTGGYIIRTVKGNRDEDYTPECNCNITYPWGSYNYTGGGTKQGAWFNGINDSELDEFQLNIAGRILKFLISRTGTAITIPKSNIKIERLVQGVTFGTSSLSVTTTTDEINLQFLITDESGNKFLFDRGDYHSEKYNADQTCDRYNYNVTDNWVLKQINTYDGQLISYDYDYSHVHYNQFKSQSVTIDYASHPRPSSTTVGTIGTDVHLDNCEESSTYWDGEMAFIKKISYPDQKFITFLYDDSHSRCDFSGSRILANIVVSDNSNYEQGSYYKYTLHQSYWLSLNGLQDVPLSQSCSTQNNVSLDTSQFRLKLNSITQEDINQNSNTYYIFSYNNSVSMPPRFSAQQDYCGFFNGKTCTPITLNGHNYNFNVPTFVGGENADGTPKTYGIDKTPDGQYAQACILTSIINGTGGETDLVYEAHDNLSASLSVPSSRAPYAPYSIASFARGVRLKSITYKDGFNLDNNKYTSYTYENGEAYLSAAESYLTFYSTCNPNTPYYTFFNSNFCANLSVNSSNQGYGKVTVIDKDKNGNTLAKTVNIFSNTLTNNLGATRTLGTSEKAFYEEPYTHKQYFNDWAIALPVESDFYDNNNSLIKKQTNSFNIITTSFLSDDFKNIHTLLKKVNCGSSGPSEVYSDIYYPSCGQYNLSSQTTTTYLVNNHISTTSVSYTYDNNGNVKTITTPLSNNETLQRKIYYNYDWTASFPSSSAISFMNSADNNFQKVLLEEVWKHVGGQDRLVSSTPYVFDLMNNNILIPSSSYELIPYIGLTGYTSGPASFNMQNAVLGAGISNYNLTTYITGFSRNGRPNELHHTMNGDEYSSEILDCDRGLTLAAVDHARHNEIAYTSFESNYKGIGQPDDNKGNWDFDQANIIDPTTVSLGTYGALQYMSGKRVFKLDPASSSANSVVSTIHPTWGKKYVLVFWTYGGHTPVITQGNTQLIINNPEFSRNGWMQNYIEFISNGQLIQITANAGSIYLDELRLYPFGSEMKSYTYEPLFGVTSICDENNKFVFFEYDGFGRQRIVRNTFGEIIAKTQFVQQGN